MKKAILLFAALGLVASACGGSADPASGDAQAATTTSAPATTTSAAPISTTSAPETTTTAAPTTTEATPFIPSGDPIIDAVAEAYMVAFDSTTDFETKLQFVDDLSGLEETVAKYLETGDSMGGVTIEVTSVEVDGDTAAVVYELFFNNNLIYPGLTGSAILTDVGWQVPRVDFCGMMASARVGCPAE